MGTPQVTWLRLMYLCVLNLMFQGILILLKKHLRVMKTRTVLDPTCSIDVQVFID